MFLEPRCGDIPTLQRARERVIESLSAWPSEGDRLLATYQHSELIYRRQRLYDEIFFIRAHLEFLREWWSSALPVAQILQGPEGVRAINARVVRIRELLLALNEVEWSGRGLRTGP